MPHAHAHVLVVDDESLVRWSLKDRLESEGYDVTVENAVEAMRREGRGVDIEDVERQLLAQALERSKGNQTQAAQLLGINRDQGRYRIVFGLLRA